MTLTLSATAGTMTSTGPVSITAFATTVALQQQGTAGQFDSVFGRVEFPFTPAPTNFTVAVTHATLATFSGTAADLQRGVVSAGHHLSANDARGGGGRRRGRPQSAGRTQCDVDRSPGARPVRRLCVASRTGRAHRRRIGRPCSERRTVTAALGPEHAAADGAGAVSVPLHQ